MQQSSVSITAAIALCMAYLLFKHYKREKTELTDYVKCALAGIVTPPSFYYLYLVVFNPEELTKLQGSITYMGLGVLVALFISGANLFSVFFPKRLPSSDKNGQA